MPSYESIYPRTPVGTLEVKTLPARTTLVASAPGDAFNDRGAAFMKLFNYIKANQIAMSVPVAASASTNEMVFFVGARALRASAPLRENGFSSPQLMNSRTNELMHFSTLPAAGGVSVQTLPEAVVASIGLRGSYSRKAFDAGAARLAAWLALRPQWRADGPPYAVYWNSPFVPWFLRKSEIHQPLKKFEVKR